MVALAACGRDTTSTSASAPAVVRPESAASSDLPALAVSDLTTGEAVLLKNLLPAGKPLLVWFWAPH